MEFFQNPPLGIGRPLPGCPISPSQLERSSGSKHCLAKSRLAELRNPMRRSNVRLVLLTVIGLVLTACGSVHVGSSRIEKKAEEYRRSGVAKDMLEARRLAEDYYWPESARMKEEQERRERAAARSTK